ncbi:hypothetical protein BJ508DRAFT_66294 [Ascobolus immersus RN42]|uniref:Uncharacterized protein n=1 Tax=Ascobolus immersus RN42 TaxID=1160509 RepID=A0A3N4IBK9_ASCIM|nr:hypothetical protein BJ508DRAFT_66294 [Ascobolus immersus RN42]
MGSPKMEECAPCSRPPSSMSMQSTENRPKSANSLPNRSISKFGNLNGSERCAKAKQFHSLLNTTKSTTFPSETQERKRTPAGFAATLMRTNSAAASYGAGAPPRVDERSEITGRLWGGRGSRAQDLAAWDDALSAGIDCARERDTAGGRLEMVDRRACLGGCRTARAG